MTTTKRRPLLFIAVYLLGALAALVFLSRGALDDLVLLAQTFLVVLFFLPYGILPSLEQLLNAIGIHARLVEAGPFPGPANFPAGILLALSYIACLALPVVGSRTKKERTFRILFISFIGLILVNVHGCSLMA